MKQNFSSGKPMSLTSISDLTVIRESDQEAGIGVYEQILRYLPGSMTPSGMITPFVNLPLDKPFNRYLKRSADIILSLIVIIGVLSWAIPVMAIIIRLDSRGPVFFLQKRNKRYGGVFTCIKFRSMIVNAEADVVPAGKYDKRITRVGRFIRKNYIDELPQFFNVLWGDMSVIGPRPHMLSDNLKYQDDVEHYQYRLKVKPGITGLAQVMGYVGATDNLRKMKDRVLMDNFYLRHWSLRLDLNILFHTFCRITGIRNS